MTSGRWARVALCAALSGFVCSAAVAAGSYHNSQAPEPVQSLPAVDGFSAKAAGFGGAAKGNGSYGGAGSVSIPLGFRYGLQIDGAVSDVNTDAQGNVTVAGTAAHLFWRNPSVGLLGLYGQYMHADAFSGIDIFAGGAEGALYLGRFTLEGAAGAQGGSADLGAFGSANSDTRFFDVAQLSYYPIDNLKLSIGHSYFFGRNAALFGAEWGFPIGHGIMAALFASGSIWEGGNGAVLGGLRFYFGRRDKSLIRRHREDDPPSYLVSNNTGIFSNGSINTGGYR